jgi:hypothetical protein
MPRPPHADELPEPYVDVVNQLVEVHNHGFLCRARASRRNGIRHRRWLWLELPTAVPSWNIELSKASELVRTISAGDKQLAQRQRTGGFQG